MSEINPEKQEELLKVYTSCHEHSADDSRYTAFFEPRLGLSMCGKGLTKEEAKDSFYIMLFNRLQRLSETELLSERLKTEKALLEKILESMTFCAEKQ